MKVILITGCNGSIGSGLINHFRKKKEFKVIGVDKDFQKKNLKFSNVSYFKIDLSNEKSQKKLFTQIEKKFNKIDILINNAGIIHNSLLVNRLNKTYKMHSFKEWKKVFSANLDTAFLTCIYAIPLMIKKKTNGLIINFSSISAKGNIGQVAYSSSKSAIETMSKTMAKELAIFNIRSLTIAPGFFNTPSTKKNMTDDHLNRIISKTPSRRLGKLSELIQSIEFLINNKFVNSKTFRLDGGIEI